MKASPLTLLRSMFGFGLVFMVGYALVLLIWGNLAPKKLWSNLQPKALNSGQQAKRFIDAASYGEVDVLAIGSSLIYKGVDTRAFAKQGIRLFNLGTSAQTPKQTALLLAAYLDKLQPKKVIINVSPAAFSTSGVESSIDIMYASAPSWPFIRLALSHGDIRGFNAAVYTSLARPLGFFPIDTSNLRPAEERYIEGGFVEYIGSQRFAPQPVRPFDIELREDQRAAFEGLMHVLRKRNLEVVLVRMPIPQVYYQAEQGRAEYESYLQRHGKFVDINKQVDLVDSLHFCDATHLNQEGVELVSPILLSL